MHTFDLKIEDMAKIEGKAGLEVKVENDEIVDLKFKITEFKRFYTQAIRGKDVVSLPQLTARICGTCSNAHLLCTIKAVENGLGIQVTEQTKLLRRLLHYGLIIRDHGLHLYVFVLPDFFKIDSLLELNENDQYQHQILHDAFEVKGVGNNLGKLVGGRSVHAPYPTIGGFIKLPNHEEFPKLIAELEKARPAVLRLIKIFQDADMHLIKSDLDFVALMDANFSFIEGDIITNRGTRIPAKDLGNYLERFIIPYSQAAGYKFLGKIHFVGALARINLGKDFINSRTKTEIGEVLDIFPSKDIFHNNLAQAIEILHAIDSSIEILKNLKIANESPQPIIKKEGVGTGVIEAPRGTLYYQLVIDASGNVKKGDIVVPTSQNQIGIERALYDYLKGNLFREKETLTTEIEKIIRAYDPCMSCAAHFLQVKWL